MVYKSFEQILERVKAKPIVSTVAVAGADGFHVIESVLEAEKMGIIKPVLIGDVDKIREILLKLGKQPENYKILKASTHADCGVQAVALVKSGEADFIMKGMVETKDVLKPLVSKENGLHTGRVMSHVALDEVPGFTRLTALTDGGMVPHPTLSEKKDIIINAVEMLRSLGYERPRVAILCGVEKVNSKMPETIDAEVLANMGETGEIRNCDIVGPISYDLAMSPKAGELKGYYSPFSGEFDILVTPTMAAGNILNKCLTVSAGGKMAGLIVGAKIPVVLTSRGSSSEEKFLSLALASLVVVKEEQCKKESSR